MYGGACLRAQRGRWRCGEGCSALVREEIERLGWMGEWKDTFLPIMPRQAIDGIAGIVAVLGSY